MNTTELYKSLISMVPVEAYDVDFRKHLSNKLKKYQEIVKRLDRNDQPDNWDTHIKRIEQLCDGIKRAVENDFKGVRHSSYSSIKNQLDGYETRNKKISKLAIGDNLLNIDKDSIFYRMRYVSIEERNKMGINDIFHIPLDKKGLVATQRYSVPGYPCLYLAERIYGCWEEMRRPDFGTIMVSAFKTKKSYKLLDLRIPTYTSWKNGIIRCLEVFPLIISSMIQVKNGSDIYKPEYIIPQLITEWIISHNRDVKKDEEKIIGIAYTSSHKNDDFNFPDNSFDNYAIPVMSPLSKSKYCKKLVSYFSVTKPTYYDLEVLKQGLVIDCGGSDLDDKQENIRISRFGEMESYLKAYKFGDIKI